MGRPGTSPTTPPSSARSSNPYTSSAANSRSRGPLVLVALLLLVPLALFSFFSFRGGDTKEGTKSLQLGNFAEKHKEKKRRADVYSGKPWKSARTVSVTTVGETRFARCDFHAVQSEDGGHVIDDWLFMEERDAINVAVQLADSQKFVVFRQIKYAIPGETLTPVGGFINNGERPFHAARREVEEELGVGSKQTQQRKKQQDGKDGNHDDTSSHHDPLGENGDTAQQTDTVIDDGSVDDDEKEDWVYLGRYRTMANRGGGFLHAYLLKNAVPLVEGGGTQAFVGEGDFERQQITLLDLDELQQAVANAQFQEVKWQATMALSLLHLTQNLQFAPPKPTPP